MQMNLGTKTQRAIKRLYTPALEYFSEKFPLALGLGSYATFFNVYADIVIANAIPKEDQCIICLNFLLEPTYLEYYSTHTSSRVPPDLVCSLKKCSHMFHLICLVSMLELTLDSELAELSISCPICKIVHGMRLGDQPLTGSMDVNFIDACLPGYRNYV